MRISGRYFHSIASKTRLMKPLSGLFLAVDEIVVKQMGVGSNRFDFTLRHADTGWKYYAKAVRTW
jgi:hypothetical protein